MDIQLHISTDEEVITPVCDFTYSWCINCGLNDPEATRFTVAVSELVSDIILFAFPYESKASFDLTFKQTLSNIEVVVSEAGEPFDPDQHRYNPKRARKEGDFEGAGLRLIRRFCDEFLFINKGKEGKEFRLSKRLNVHDIDELLELSRSKKPEEPDSSKTAVPEDISYTISQITPSDAEDIAKLIYRTYEYSYSKEDLYYPKKIEKTLLGKEKLGVITRNQNGMAIGYFAVLKKEDSNVAEVGEAVVSPDYRRRGIMSSMMEQLILTAKEHQLDGLYGKAVTLHPVSQRVNHKYNFITTALMLAESNNIVFKGFDEEYPQPVSVVIDYLPLFETEGKKVYLPEPYADILLETYNELGVSVSRDYESSPTMAEKSDIQLTIDYQDNTSLIVVNRYGSDFNTVLSNMLESLQEQENPNAVYIDLPLENSATPEQFDIVKSLGFIYCGLAPMFHQDSDYLRLQKINTALELELIEIFSDFGQKIKALIADEYC
ncbi:GNAT family N-acetyltransferase [Fodinibius halophilus]|uniref:GNAT family N-acetyltransferase n=1 Tax=Fodinibius halophilus TaxID=1736908 RepID=A0A6M1SY32_9BACT|nr:GNAT family N-acetyltransferase [Fodinibius halophilus]NGP88808.1 GNAT family N-acetyltransferase [Fodinibius halophilus]